ncbi:unnamed protein product [[Candida] boidinii]|uniref:Unnamed protein product n=1 Tax=Candida boidinii TaxID=5477 RepID=A0A9W6WEM2_CANBO|nr:unnamed protein product [[Candida] boidinii]GMG18355.1 unnamed protein product [[Candida] boidinii]
MIWWIASNESVKTKVIPKPESCQARLFLVKNPKPRIKTRSTECPHFASSTTIVESGTCSPGKSQCNEMVLVPFNLWFGASMGQATVNDEGNFGGKLWSGCGSLGSCPQQ